MYLADSLRLISSGLSDYDRETLPSRIVSHKIGIAEKILNEAKMYAFEKSALEMGGSMKISDPVQLHLVLQSALSVPEQSYWLEAKGGEREKALSHLRDTILRPHAQNEGTPYRTGVLLRTIEPGVAEYRPVWNFAGGDPASRLRKEAMKALEREGRKRSKLERKALSEFLKLNVNCGYAVIDVRHEPNYPTPAHFLDLVHKGDKNASICYRFATKQNSPTVFGQSLQPWEVTRIAWWAYCMGSMEGMALHFTNSDTDYIRETASIGRQVSDILAEAESNMSGEITYIAAMLSVLAAETGKRNTHSAIATVDRPEKRTRIRRPISPNQVDQDRLRIISMNIQDRNTMRRTRTEPISNPTRSGRLRNLHFVNGHLFRARNGKMTWRRPHWRGTATGQATLTRVL